MFLREKSSIKITKRPMERIKYITEFCHDGWLVRFGM